MIVRELITTLGFKLDQSKLNQFDTLIDKTKNKAMALGESLKGVGESLTKYLTLPLVGLGALALKNWDEQAKAIASVQQGLDATGNKFNFKIEELTKAASAIQSKSLFGDDQILSDVTAQLLTFGNIGKENFFEIQQAAVDISSKMKRELLPTTILVAKALNDPVRNLSALSRNGIQFSKLQEDRIAKLIKQNKLAEAQRLILKEINTYYKNSAAEEAASGLGPLKQAFIEFGDALEEFGLILAEIGIIPFSKKIRQLSAWLQSLDPKTKKIVVVFGLLLAAIGPLLIGLGSIITAVAALKVSLAVLGIGFLPLIGIIAAVIAAIVAIILTVWDLIVFFKGGESAIGDFFNFMVGIWKKQFAFIVGVLKSFKDTAMSVYQAVSEYMVIAIRDAVFKIIRLLDLPRQKMLQLLDIGGVRTKIEGLTGFKAGDDVNLLEKKVNEIIGIPQSVSKKDGGALGSSPTNNIHNNLSQKVEIKVGANDDQEAIKEKFKSVIDTFFGRELRNAQNFTSQGAT